MTKKILDKNVSLVEEDVTLQEKFCNSKPLLSLLTERY